MGSRGDSAGASGGSGRAWGRARRRAPRRKAGDWRWLLLYLLLASGWVTGYLILTDVIGETGFPLDDAWIHQTYARSLALTGRWEYLPGQPSAGSTSPLWTVLLTAGYLLSLPYQWWAWGLGVLGLGLSGWLAHQLAAGLFAPGDRQKPASTIGGDRARPGQRSAGAARWVAPAVGVLCVSEWHLVWAAASGMETILFVALSLALMGRVTSCSLRHPPRVAGCWAGVGLLAGGLILTRPEGVVLVGLTGLWLVTHYRRSPREMWRAAAGMAVPFAALVLPYLLLNVHLGGRWWPNTFYAKQAEYAGALAAPLLVRLWRVTLPPLTGFQVLLVPGLLLMVWHVIRAFAAPSSAPSPGGGSGPPPGAAPVPRGWRVLPLAFAALHILLYAVRLPAVYQHGRYLIPTIPVLILYGVVGSEQWLRPRNLAFWRRVISRSWMVATVVLVPLFLWVGARAFAKDVQIIQTEMVATAEWLSENTGPDEWVAAHDIGALGYFAGRPILDLAGLISPEVVPLMGEEAALAEYILAGRARYLVTAPGWKYEEVVGRPDVVHLYTTGSQWTLAEGMNNSAVYRLPCP